MAGFMHQTHAAKASLRASRRQLVSNYLISGHRKQRFDDKDRTPSITDNLYSDSSIDDLCYFLRNEAKSRLCMNVEEGIVSQTKWQRRKLDIADAPSISLKEALPAHYLARTARLALIIVIANSYWQFYTSKWMRRPWTKDDLYFFLEYDEDDNNECQIFAQRPYFSTFFESSNAIDRTTGRQHSRPKILALGIILLEVELGLSLQDEWQRKDLKANGDPTSNTDYCTALDLVIDQSRWKKRDTFPLVRKAIKVCIEDDFGECETVEEERDAIYKKVVAPLEHLWPDVTDQKLADLASTRDNPMRRRSDISFTSPLALATGSRARPLNSPLMGPELMVSNQKMYAENSSVSKILSLVTSYSENQHTLILGNTNFVMHLEFLLLRNGFVKSSRLYILSSLKKIPKSEEHLENHESRWRYWIQDMSPEILS